MRYLIPVVIGAILGFIFMFINTLHNQAAESAQFINSCEVYQGVYAVQGNSVMLIYKCPDQLTGERL